MLEEVDGLRYIVLRLRQCLLNDLNALVDVLPLDLRHLPHLPDGERHVALPAGEEQKCCSDSLIRSSLEQEGNMEGQLLEGPY